MVSQFQAKETTWEINKEHFKLNCSHTLFSRSVEANNFLKTGDVIHKEIDLNEIFPVNKNFLFLLKIQCI